MNKLIKLGLVLLVIYGLLRLFGINPIGGSDGSPSLKDLQAKALQEGKDKIVVLLTGTSWCPYCVDLDREVISTGAWTSFASSEVVFASYEYPAFRRPSSGPRGEMLKRFQPEGFPSMFVLDRNGNLLGEEAGYGSGGVGRYTDWIRSL